MSLASRGVGLVGTVILAGYVLPVEYGEVTAASIVAATASTVSAFGIGIYLVANRDLSRREIFHATCLYVATGAIALGMAWALRNPLGAWCETRTLARFLPFFLVSTLFDRISFLPERMLVRQLRFRWLSLARASSELAYTAVSLSMAALGAGAIAIAWGSLARSVLRLASILPAVHWREWLEPHRLRVATMLKIFGYGMNVSGTAIAAYAMSRWDNLLVSRYFGPAAMGTYNYAYNLADTPATAVGEQMADVVNASFPHVSQEKRVPALVRSWTMLSLIMLPLAFGLGAVAQTAVHTFLDPKWSSVGRMLSILAVLAATKPLTYVLYSYLYAGGRPRIVLYLEASSLAAVVVGIVLVGRMGTLWTCGWVGAAFVLRAVAAIWTLRRVEAISVSRLLRPLVGPLVTCVAMVVAIAFVRPALHGLPSGAQLLIEVAVGAGVYLGGALLIFRSAAAEFLALVRSALVSR